MQTLLDKLNLTSKAACIPQSKLEIAYRRKMQDIEDECLFQLEELLLEHNDLLYHCSCTNSGSIIDYIHIFLKVQTHAYYNFIQVHTNICYYQM